MELSILSAEQKEQYHRDGYLILNNFVSKDNKIGHALHDLDPVFAQFSRSSQLAKQMSEPRVYL